MKIQIRMMPVYATLLIAACIYPVVTTLIENWLMKSSQALERERVRLDGMRTGILIEHCRVRCSSFEFEYEVLADPSFDDLQGYVLPFGPSGKDQCVCILAMEPPDDGDVP